MILHLVDEATRCKWIYLQKTKDETAVNIDIFLNMIKAKYGR